MVISSWLYKNQIGINNFCYLTAYVIHPPHPLHWILRFQLFGYALTLGVFFDQPKKKELRFFLYIGEMGAELAGSEQIAVQDFVVLL